MRKVILVALCLMMAGMLTVGGTFATDDTNPLGGIFHWLSTEVFGEFAQPTTAPTQVKVENVYQVRGGNTLVKGEQTLLPAYGSNWNSYTDVTLNGYTYRLWDANAPKTADKFVSVRNSTTSPEGQSVYFRTAIAIQNDLNQCSVMHLNRNMDPTYYSWSGPTGITIEGKPYQMWVATYQHALAPGKTSPAMIMQVGLDATASTAMLKNGLDIRVTTAAIGINGFKQNDVQMTAEEALDMAVPLDTFNPFK